VRFDKATSPLESEQVKTSVIQAESALAKTGRVLLRKSGTEPLIRVMVEAESETDSDKWAEYIAEAVRKASE
jgi:phosphoglucosamine mutase